MGLYSGYIGVLLGIYWCNAKENENSEFKVWGLGL